MEERGNGNREYGSCNPRQNRIVLKLLLTNQTYRREITVISEAEQVTKTYGLQAPRKCRALTETTEGGQRNPTSISETQKPVQK
jgi:hypothetical protein